MKVSGERYFPRLGSKIFAPFEPYVSYEHWHRYCYALPLVAGKTVLDIASGEGYGSAFLASHAALVYGVDISPEAVEHARGCYVRDNLHFLQGAADEIPIPGRHRFDVIISFETIEHLDEPTQERFAAEITRLLKPDGVLVVSTPNRATYNEEGQQGNPYHLHEFTKDEFVAFLRRYFADVRLLSQHVYPVSYIWNADGSTGSLVEYEMSLSDGRFRPATGDNKEIGYLIAVCAHETARAAATDSILIDLSEVAFKGMPTLELWQTTSLFTDCGAGFQPDQVVRQETVYRPEFALRFTLDASTPAKQLRWDPLEMCLCQVRLRKVFWEDSDGLVFPLDLGQVTSNGSRRDEATFQFETLDPMIFLPISGRVASVTIEGECIAADGPTTLAGLEQAVRSRTQQLAHQEQEYRVMRQQLGVYEELTAAHQHQLALHVQELDDARRQLGLQETSIVDLSRDLENHKRQLRLLKERVLDLEQARTQLGASLQAIVNSKRWIVINGVRSVLYFLPSLVRSTARRLFGTRGHDEESRPVVTLEQRPRAGRPPSRRSRSNRKTHV